MGEVSSKAIRLQRWRSRQLFAHILAHLIQKILIIKSYLGVFEKIAIVDAIAELADDRVGDLDFNRRIVNIIL